MTSQNQDQVDPNLLLIINHGALIIETNFWETTAARNGALFLSIHAGEARLLVPDRYISSVEDMKKGSEYVILSQLPYGAWRESNFCTELLFEDHSRDPFSINLAPSRVSDSIAQQSDGKETLRCSVWVNDHGSPFRVFELPMRVRMVRIMPHLMPWGRIHELEPFVNEFGMTAQVKRQDGV